MDSKRRQFFKELGSKSIGIAAAGAAPAMAHLNALSEEVKALSRNVNDQLSKLSAETKGQIQSLHNRLDGAALTLSYQQMQLYFIFLLLVISFSIDAGMTAAMALA